MYRSFRQLIIRNYCCLNHYSSNVPLEIKLPKKIYRDELSVLKALNNCVKFEKGSSEYMMIDQPYTIPGDFLKRKRFILSKMSGRYSAKMAFKEMKNEFINVALDEPRVKCLLPLISGEDIEREVREKRLSPEKGLSKLIRLFLPVYAWSFYNTNKSINFSSEVIQNLLELLCATAGVDPDLCNNIDNVFERPEVVKWRIDNSAEILFAEITDKTTESYCTIIRGAAKFNDVFRALEHLQIMKTNLPKSFIDLKTANALLRSLANKKLSDNEVKDIILEVFRGMAVNKIVPTTQTFNNAIFAFSNRHPFSFIQSIYAEMISIGLVPTLGTYALLLRCKFPRAVIHGLCMEVLELLEARGNDYEEVSHSDDQLLFEKMMYYFTGMWRVDLALRLNAIVVKGGHIHLFESDQPRWRYFDNLSTLLVYEEKDLATALNVLEKIVPVYCSVRVTAISELLERVNRGGLIHLLPRVMLLVSWSVKKVYLSNVYPRALDLFAEAVDEIKRDPALHAAVSKCFWRIIGDCGRHTKSVFTIPAYLEATMMLALNIGEWPLFWTLTDMANVYGHVRAATVRDPMIVCVNEKNFDRVLYLWQCLANCVHQRANVTDPDSLRSLIDLTETEILPTLASFDVSVREIRSNIDQCRMWFERKVMEADFDKEDALNTKKDLEYDPVTTDDVPYEKPKRFLWKYAPGSEA